MTVSEPGDLTSRGHVDRGNPRAVRQTVTLLSLFLHLGPYARHIIGETEKTVAEVDAGKFTPPPLVPASREVEPLALLE